MTHKNCQCWSVRGINLQNERAVYFPPLILTKRINIKDNGTKKNTDYSDPRTWLTLSYTESKGSADAWGTSVWVMRLQHLHLQVLLSSLLRQAGSNGLMCCNFWAKTTWILGTNEAGGLCTLCSSAVSVHSIGSRREEASLRRGIRLRFSGSVSCTDAKIQWDVRPGTVRPVPLLKEQEMALHSLPYTDFRLAGYY